MFICNSGYRNDYHDWCVTNISFLSYAIFIEISSPLSGGMFSVVCPLNLTFHVMTSKASGNFEQTMQRVTCSVLFGICAE